MLSGRTGGGSTDLEPMPPLRVKPVSEESLSRRHSGTIQIGKPPLNLAGRTPDLDNPVACSSDHALIACGLTIHLPGHRKIYGVRK